GDGVAGRGSHDDPSADREPRGLIDEDAVLAEVLDRDVLHDVRRRAAGPRRMDAYRAEWIRGALSVDRHVLEERPRVGGEHERRAAVRHENGRPARGRLDLDARRNGDGERLPGGGREACGRLEDNLRTPGG